MSQVRQYVEPTKLGRVMRRGCRGADVKLVQTILQREGYFKGTPLGNFFSLTEEAVRYFQNTHIGKDGEFLAVDGAVGPNTWWALHNPNGSAQRNFIPTEETAVVESDKRMRFVSTLYKMHKDGIKEIPDGSNYGGDVTLICNSCGFSYGIYWCLAALSYAWKETFNSAPLGAMHVHCSTFWNEAVVRDCSFPKLDYEPMPGDIAIYNYKGGLKSSGRLAGAGHAAAVVRVDHDGSRFNALEGNVGNRFKHSIRRESEASLVGYVNLFGDAYSRPNFKKGVTSAPEITVSLADSR